MEGIPVVRPGPFKCSIAEPTGFRLISDTHIGNPHADLGKLEKELKHAKDNGDRILINGDVFDMILPSDNKRFKITAMDKRLVEADDIIGKTVDWAVQILEPYVSNIDMIGIGNHETAVIKRHHVDPVKLLIHRLNRECGGKVSYGDYLGFADYRFRMAGTRCYRYVIAYFHGAGGGAHVTKGLISLYRMEVWMRGDVIWLGHHHSRVLDATPVEVFAPQEGDIAKTKPFRAIITGGYLDSTVGPLNYAREKGYAPQQTGGARLHVKFSRTGGIEEVLTTM